MRRLLSVIILSAMMIIVPLQAIERVTLEQLQADWSRYTNQMVELTTPLVVCGNYYDSLVLAPTRLVSPDECAAGLAEGDSTDYYRIAAANRATSICVHLRNSYYNVRTGDRVRKLKARVTGERQLVTGQPVHTRHTPVRGLRKRGKGELRIAGANIENYFADLGGYATKRTTPKQQALKTRKLVKAMRRMDADIYALCEIQTGDKAPRMLLNELNRGGRHYAYVRTGLPDRDRIGGGFIYRTDRVQPYGALVSAYSDSTGHYHARMLTQGFEQLDRRQQPTGKRLIVSVNHLKSKRPGRGQYDTNLKRMENTDSLLSMLPMAIEQFGDEDVLLLGDYNCYTMEQPIQTIVRAGYSDQLQLYCPDDYSYTYHSETGYLDRCFANPPMASQVVYVMPWHVNADWYYQHGAYKLKDKSLHRYADHDPIIVDIQLK